MKKKHKSLPKFQTRGHLLRDLAACFPDLRQVLRQLRVDQAHAGVGREVRFLDVLLEARVDVRGEELRDFLCLPVRAELLDLTPGSFSPQAMRCVISRGESRKIL